MVSKIVDLFVDTAIEKAEKLKDRYLMEISWDPDKADGMDMYKDGPVIKIFRMANNIESSITKDYKFPHYKSHLSYMAESKFYKLDPQSQIMIQIIRTYHDDPPHLPLKIELREWLKKFVEMNKIIDELPDKEKLKIAYGFPYAFENPESNNYYSEVEFQQSSGFRKIVSWISLSWVFSMMDDGQYFFWMHRIVMPIEDEDSQNHNKKVDSFESLFRKTENAAKLKTIMERNGYTRDGIWISKGTKELINIFIAIEPILCSGPSTQLGPIFVKEFGYTVGSGGTKNNRIISGRSLRPVPDRKLGAIFEGLFSELLHPE